jgi:hypothetical protein
MSAPTVPFSEYAPTVATIKPDFRQVATGQDRDLRSLFVAGALAVIRYSAIGDINWRGHEERNANIRTLHGRGVRRGYRRREDSQVVDNSAKIVSAVGTAAGSSNAQSRTHARATFMP